MRIPLSSSYKTNGFLLHSKQCIKRDSFVNCPAILQYCKYGSINVICNVCASLGSEFANLRMTHNFLLVLFSKTLLWANQITCSFLITSENFVEVVNFDIWDNFIYWRLFRMFAFHVAQYGAYSTIVRQYGSTEVWQYGAYSSTVREYDRKTVRQYDSTAVWQYGSTARTVQQYDSTAVRQYGSTTVRQYGSTTVRNTAVR